MTRRVVDALLYLIPALPTLFAACLVYASFAFAAPAENGATVQNTLTAAETQAGWQLLFDGRSLDHWRASEGPGTYRVSNGQLIVKLLERDANGEPVSTFFVRDGELVATGPRAHLFYIGPVAHAQFRNFELSLEAKTYPGANSGVYFHTEFQEVGWPAKGYEVQVNNSFPTDNSRTGGLWGIQNSELVPVPDGEWFTLKVRVEGKRIVTRVNDRVIADYTEEAQPQRPDDLKGRLLGSGTIALQAHHVGNEVHYRNIKVRVLP